MRATDARPGLERFRMLIDGEWCVAASGCSFETKNPFTGRGWATIPRADATDVDRAVEAAGTFGSTPIAW